MKRILLLLLTAVILQLPAAAQKLKTLPDNAPASFATELNRLLADAYFDFKNTIDAEIPGTEDDILIAYYSKVQLPFADSCFMEEALNDYLETYHQFIANFGQFPTRGAASVNFKKIAQYINKSNYNSGQLQQKTTEDKEKLVLQSWQLKPNKGNANTKVELSMTEKKVWPAGSSKSELAWVIELRVY
ncbi:MAG: hypothetical protein PHD73_12435 [Sediminibacterium sp.]|nr:hypothetical protein [Sediminibacterium sp.]